MTMDRKPELPYAPRDILEWHGRAARPIARWELPFAVDGLPIQFIGERWRLEDQALCAYPIIPDPRCPGEGCVILLRSLVTGEISRSLSPEEAQAWRGSGSGTDDRPDPRFGC